MSDASKPKFVFPDDTNRDYLTYIEAVKAGVDKGGIVSDGLETEDLLDLQNRLHKERFPFPDEYANFLRQVNGFSYPGSIIFYGMHYGPDSDRQDLFTVNREMSGDYPKQMQDRLVIGESFSYRFAFNKSAQPEKSYERLFHNFAVDETYPSLMSLVTKTVTLRNILGSDTSAARQPRTPRLQ